MNDTDAALEILRPRLVGRRVTYVTLDYAVSLGFTDEPPYPQLRIEEDFTVVEPDGTLAVIDPENVVPHAAVVARLFRLVVEDVELLSGSTLVLRFRSGSRLQVAPHGGLEAWEFASDDGAKVIALPSSGLAVWSARAGS